MLPDVFIASYEIAKCVREITKGSVMCLYLTTNELIYDQMNIRAIVWKLLFVGSSHADVFCIDLVPILVYNRLR